MTSRLLINIVYTPGTVAYLLPFAHSLLVHGEARYRLVDNGCLMAERRLLEAFAARHDRVEIWVMPGEGCRPHAEVLNRLRLLPNPGIFCFLDSDIVASGPFEEALETALQTASAAFSGAPVWLTHGDGVFRARDRSMTGELIRDEQGRCLGCTYVAAYAAEPLARAIANYGVGFDEYRWEDLSEPVQARLEDRGRRADRYDTGRVLANLIDGGLAYIALPNLHHIGGFSFPALDGSALAGQRVSRLPAMLRRMLAAWGYLRLGGIGEAAALARRRVMFRDPVRRHFWTLTHALMRGDAPPVPPQTGDAGVDLRVRDASEAIGACYAAFRASEPMLARSARA